jgi:hypothetical protein
MEELEFNEELLKGAGLSDADIQKVSWINNNYKVYPGMLLVTIPESAYEDNALESGFNTDNKEELTEHQKKASLQQRKNFEEEYLKKGDELLVLARGKVEENDVTGIFNFSNPGDLVTLHGHARLQGIDLDMSYVASDGSLVDTIHVTILRGSDVLMKRK